MGQSRDKRDSPGTEGTVPGQSRDSPGGQTGQSRDRRDSPGTVPRQGHCGTDPQPDSFIYMIKYIFWLPYHSKSSFSITINRSLQNSRIMDQNPSNDKSSFLFTVSTHLFGGFPTPISTVMLFQTYSIYASFKYPSSPSTTASNAASVI